MKQLRNIKIGLLLPHLLSDTDKALIQVLNKYIRKDVEVLFKKYEDENYTRYYYYGDEDIIIYELTDQRIFLNNYFIDKLKQEVDEKYSSTDLMNIIKYFIQTKQPVLYHNQKILLFNMDYIFYLNLKQELLLNK